MALESFTRTNNYRGDDADSDSSSGEHHYYQNQSTKKQAAKRRKKQQQQQHHSNPHQLGQNSATALVSSRSALNSSNHSLYYHTQHGFILGTHGLGGVVGGGLGSTSSGMASSTASSDRPLILRRKKFKISYFLIILAVFFLTLSLISIAVSFIFPFWLSVSLLNESRNVSSIING